VNFMIMHGLMDGPILLGHVKIGFGYVVISLLHFLFWSICKTSMYNFKCVNVHQKGIHPMLYQLGKINWPSLFFAINGLLLLLVGGLSLFFRHFSISYCTCCNINLLDLVWAPHGVSKQHSTNFINHNSHSSSTSVTSNHVSSIKFFIALSKI
jgi:hypothetical protein